ncbi:DsbA family protein [soil metagenome]
MADVDFFWDPVCPWAWITSRWVDEVAEQRDLDVDWRFIALRIVNEEKDYDKDFPPRYVEGHTLGLHLLRVAAAVREQHGRKRLGELYTAFGTRIHFEGDAPSLRERDGIAVVLDGLGLPKDLADAADDEAWDEPVRADTATALERAGSNLGTPILTFSPPDGPSFFGPVVNVVPRGEDAVRIWDAVTSVAEFPGFSELKRSLRGSPQVAG